MRAALRPRPLRLYDWRGGRIVRCALVAAHGRGTSAGRWSGRWAKRRREAESGRHGAAVAGLRVSFDQFRDFEDARRPVPRAGGGLMIGSISGKIKAKAALMDPGRYGRSDTSLDRPLVLGDRQGPAAADRGADRHRADRRRRRLARGRRSAIRAATSISPSSIISGASSPGSALGIPVMIGISMMPRERARRLSLFGAAFFFVLLILVPIVGPEHERRPALDRVRPRPGPAVGIPEAVLRRRDGLAAVASRTATSRCRSTGCPPCSPAPSPSC